MTFILSSHILPEVELLCDRILIINQGRIVAQGKSWTFATNMSRGTPGGSRPRGTTATSQGSCSNWIPRQKSPMRKKHRSPTPSLSRHSTRGLWRKHHPSPPKGQASHPCELAHLEPSQEEIFPSGHQTQLGSDAHPQARRHQPSPPPPRMKKHRVIYRHEIFLLLIAPSTYFAGFLFLSLFWFLYTWHISCPPSRVKIYLSRPFSNISGYRSSSWFRC